jgi:hypothetical protein
MKEITRDMNDLMLSMAIFVANCNEYHILTESAVRSDVDYTMMVIDVARCYSRIDSIDFDSCTNRTLALTVEIALLSISMELGELIDELPKLIEANKISSIQSRGKSILTSIGDMLKDVEAILATLIDNYPDFTS